MCTTTVVHAPDKIFALKSISACDLCVATLICMQRMIRCAAKTVEKTERHATLNTEGAATERRSGGNVFFFLFLLSFLLVDPVSSEDLCVYVSRRHTHVENRI